jgi:hypothetical protein
VSALRGLSVLAGALMALIAVPFLALAGWAVLFGLPTAAVLGFTAAWLLLPLFHNLEFIRVLKFGVSFMLVPATLALTPMMVSEANSRIEELSRRDRTHPAAFSLADKTGIYGLNLVMAGVAAPLYPEAARATFLLCFPAPNKEQLRIHESEFGLGSGRIRRQLEAWVLTLDTVTVAEREFGPASIVWNPDEYRFGNPEARYALALNQTQLRMKATRQGRRWRLDVRHLVGIAYPKDALVPLITRPRLSMEEGLFWVLQQSGWLHPYNALWRFTVGSDDKRLR